MTNQRLRGKTTLGCATYAVRYADRARPCARAPVCVRRRGGGGRAALRGRGGPVHAIHSERGWARRPAAIVGRREPFRARRGGEGGKAPPLRTHEARAVWRWLVAREIPAVAVIRRKAPYRAISKGILRGAFDAVASREAIALVKTSDDPLVESKR